MSLPNTRKQATTFLYGGAAFKLSPLISKMEALEEHFGLDYFEIIDTLTPGVMLNPSWDAAEAKAKGDDYDVDQVITDPNKPGNPLNLSWVFFFLQDNEQRYTRDEIHEYLFADMSETGIGSKEAQEQIMRVLMALKGLNYQDMITEQTAKKKPAAKKRRPTAA